MRKTKLSTRQASSKVAGSHSADLPESVTKARSAFLSSGEVSIAKLQQLYPHAAGSASGLYYNSSRSGTVKVAKKLASASKPKTVSAQKKAVAKKTGGRVSAKHKVAKP